MLKAIIGGAVAMAALFFFMGLQTGAFGPNRGRGSNEENQETKEARAKKSAPRARFPEDLAPAARGQPVPAAAEFAVGNKPHKLAILKPNGAPHKWQEDAEGYSEEWAASSVEETELVIIVSWPQTKTLIETVHFHNGPPIERHRFELEASIIEAKTGKVLANRTFISMPRKTANHELYEVTALGSPVRYLTVFNWVASQARSGFNAAQNAAPLVTTVERQ
jgi:hypothetical protein